VVTKTVIIITGPTASGKTSLAIKVAKHYATEIISADSRQCFIEMNIGVAKPSARELNEVQHYFINTHSIHDEVNAATFAEYSNKIVEQLFHSKDVVIIAGGTGLYIKAFIDGLDVIPDVPANIRKEITEQYKEKGIGWLQEQVKITDPLFYDIGEINNPRRLMRALEVKLGTGISIKDFHKAHPGDAASSKYNIKKFAIDIPRHELYANINNRVNVMMEIGLLDEVKSLMPYKHLNALQTVGYSELFDYLDGKSTREYAVEKIKQNTRNYAKRQMTWLRKEKDLTWVKGLDEIVDS
jgi:tRNA dimethylallyltransferase